jgi:hypothetical protein
MNIVLDTNALLSATLWNNSEAQKLLFYLINMNANLYVSMPIIIEYQKVMQRDFKFTEQETIEATTKILKIFQMVTPKEEVNIIKNDETDNKILECAICANAQYLITYDKHLLNVKKFRNIEIIQPKEFPQKIAHNRHVTCLYLGGANTTYVTEMGYFKELRKKDRVQIGVYLEDLCFCFLFYFFFYCVYV